MKDRYVVRVSVAVIVFVEEGSSEQRIKNEASLIVEDALGKTTSIWYHVEKAEILGSSKYADDGTIC